MRLFGIEMCLYLTIFVVCHIVITMIINYRYIFLLQFMLQVESQLLRGNHTVYIPSFCNFIQNGVQHNWILSFSEWSDNLRILLSGRKAIEYNIKLFVSKRIQVFDSLPFNESIHNDNLGSRLQEFNKLINDFVVVSTRENALQNTFNFVNNKEIRSTYQVIST